MRRPRRVEGRADNDGTNHRQSVIVTSLSTVVLTFALAVSALAQSVACGSEATVARQRAEKLRHAVTTCENYFAQGAESCTVKIDWKNNEHVPPAAATRLAEDLDQFATRMEGFDQALADLYAHYEVNGRGTYVSAPGALKCQKTGAFPESDATATCVLGCYAEHSPEIADCWSREDIRVMGLCLLNEGGRLIACKKNCQPDS